MLPTFPRVPTVIAVPDQCLARVPDPSTNSSDSFTNFVSTNLRIFDLNMSFVIYIDSIYLKFVVTGK